MQCKVNNKLTLPELRNTTPKEEDTEAVEDTKVMEDIEAKEGVEEHLAMVEGRSSAITMDNKDTSHGIVR
jgi:hypothetical protein